MRILGMDDEVNLELVPMEEDIKNEWSAYQVTKPNSDKSVVKRVDDATKVQKRTNKVKPGKQPKVPDEKLTEKACDHFSVMPSVSPWHKLGHMIKHVTVNDRI